jgi:16S rRNA (guanine527-N7)-methyltransferase
MKTIQKYFKDLTEEQLDQLNKLQYLYQDWNLKINVVSRKDIDELYLRHVLHSLGIAKVISFKPGSRIIDIGTGGGFPGIPLAILFPESQFHLVDSIGKKIKVVDEVVQGLDLKNVISTNSRAESIQGQYEFIVSRAVARMDSFVGWVKHLVAKKNIHEIRNGILYLKGGDLSEELSGFPKANIIPMNSFFDEPYFETKSIVHLPLKNRSK